MAVGSVLQKIADACVVLWTVGDRLRNVYRISTNAETRDRDKRDSVALAALFACCAVILVVDDRRRFLQSSSTSS